MAIVVEPYIATKTQRIESRSDTGRVLEEIVYVYVIDDDLENYALTAICNPGSGYTLESIDVQNPSAPHKTVTERYVKETGSILLMNPLTHLNTCCYWDSLSLANIAHGTPISEWESSDYSKLKLQGVASVYKYGTIPAVRLSGTNYLEISSSLLLSTNFNCYIYGMVIDSSSVDPHLYLKSSVNGYEYKLWFTNIPYVKIYDYVPGYGQRVQTITASSSVSGKVLMEIASLKATNAWFQVDGKLVGDVDLDDTLTTTNYIRINSNIDIFAIWITSVAFANPMIVPIKQFMVSRYG